MHTTTAHRPMPFLSSVRVAGLSMLAVSVFALGTIAVVAQDADVNTKSGDTPPPVVKPLDQDAVPATPEFLPQLSLREQRILNALSNPIEVSFVDSPLYEAIEVLKDLNQIEIWLDKESLSTEGHAMDQPISLTIAGVTLRSTLKLLLEPLHLTYVIEDEVMKITTQKGADKTLVTRTYPVSDLFATRDEADELLQSLYCGLGLPQKEKDSPKSLAVSVPSGAIIARLSRPQNDQLLQLLRDLREAKKLVPVRTINELNAVRDSGSRPRRNIPPQDEFSPGLAPDNSQKTLRTPDFELEDPIPPKNTSLKPGKI